MNGPIHSLREWLVVITWHWQVNSVETGWKLWEQIPPVRSAGPPRGWNLFPLLASYASQLLSGLSASAWPGRYQLEDKKENEKKKPDIFQNFCNHNMIKVNKSYVTNIFVCDFGKERVQQTYQTLNMRKWDTIMCAVACRSAFFIQRSLRTLNPNNTKMGLSKSFKNHPKVIALWKAITHFWLRNSVKNP